MLQVFPFRKIIQGVFVATVLLVAVVSWLIGREGDHWTGALLVLRSAPLMPFVFVVILYGAWRAIRPLQRRTFPYIGGIWRGSLEFTLPNGRSGTKPVKLQVSQGLLNMRLRLETDESVSRTLAVVPERDNDFGEFRLYYTYVVERKEGVGAAKVYRGTAIMQVSIAPKQELKGIYFTEHKSTGSVALQRSDC